MGVDLYTIALQGPHLISVEAGTFLAKNEGMKRVESLIRFVKGYDDEGGIPEEICDDIEKDFTHLGETWVGELESLSGRILDLELVVMDGQMTHEAYLDNILHEFTKAWNRNSGFNCYDLGQHKVAVTGYECGGDGEPPYLYEVVQRLAALGCLEPYYVRRLAALPSVRPEGSPPRP
jgi:hypothetical protein